MAERDRQEQQEERDLAMDTAARSEPDYEVAELMAASLVQFGVQPEVLAGAVHFAGRPARMTITQAREAIAAFLRQEG